MILRFLQFYSYQELLIEIVELIALRQNYH
jgi:hypothetical protein